MTWREKKYSPSPSEFWIKTTQHQHLLNFSLSESLSYSFEIPVFVAFFSYLKCSFSLFLHSMIWGTKVLPIQQIILSNFPIRVSLMTHPEWRIAQQRSTDMSFTHWSSLQIMKPEKFLIKPSNICGLHFINAQAKLPNVLENNETNEWIVIINWFYYQFERSFGRQMDSITLGIGAEFHELISQPWVVIDGHFLKLLRLGNLAKGLKVGKMIVQISRDFSIFNQFKVDNPRLAQVLLRCRSDQFHQSGFKSFVECVFINLFLMSICQRQFLILFQHFQVFQTILENLGDFAGNRFDANHVCCWGVDLQMWFTRSTRRSFIVKARRQLGAAGRRWRTETLSNTTYPLNSTHPRESKEQVWCQSSCLELAWEHDSTLDLSNLSCDGVIWVWKHLNAAERRPLPRTPKGAENPRVLIAPRARVTLSHSNHQLHLMVWSLCLSPMTDYSDGHFGQS